MPIAYLSRPSKLSIAVTTPPTTTSYMQGDTFDPTGMVVTATRRDGSTEDVTAYCTFSPSVLTTEGTQTVIIGYNGKTTTTSISVSEVSISITTPPTTTEFEKGQPLDLTGIVVTAMNGQRTKNVTSQCTFSPADGEILSTAGDVTVTATYYGHTASTTVSVIGLTDISITTPPTKTIYKENEQLDLTGIVVTADYGAYTRDVTAQCTFNPTNGTTLSTSTTTLTVTFMDKTTTMPITIIASTLDATDWATIQAIGAQGTGSQYWSIGDTKTITLNGSIGSNFSLSKYQCKVFIIHFNYRSQNGVYFQGFKTTDGVDIAFCDSKYSKSSAGSKAFSLFHWIGSGSYAIPYGSWSGSDMRYDILGSTDVAPSGYGSAAVSGRVGHDPTSTCNTSPKSGTLMAALPEELRNALAPWTVYSYNNPLGNGTSYDTSAYVTATIDYLPLLAQYEVTGTYGNGGINANRYEHNYQEYMTYYRNGNSKIKYRSDKSTTAGIWWTRSSRVSATTTWIQIGNKGAVGSAGSNICYGIAPAFRVA